MRHVAFLAAGLALLILQANVFRLLDGVPVFVVMIAWIAAVVVDVGRVLRPSPAHPRPIVTFRVDRVLPATVLLGYVLLVSFGHAHVSRPCPGLVLPLIMFMGVHEYSLVRGALVAFLLGYATDVIGIAPVGLHAFAYVATFVLSRAAGVRLAAQTTWMQVLLVLAFSLLQSTMLLVLLAIFGRDAWVPRAMYPLALPHAIATAAVAPLVFRFAQAIETASGGAQRVPPTASFP
jgi:rod shape-determining protein MreD